jgi:DNA polymerase-3 subunit gamma/tau
MAQALYRTYRPKALEDVAGQKHITDTLSKALKAGRISHAYLFTGPRGVGKTSIARILAHAINGLPYTDDSSHIDIIEIDAASNRRIDEIRELRERVYITPTEAKYKVYIIDEVHMLTREAFNALLKTLEEPPEHVVFMLATTDVHKLPPTIISRTQRYSLKPIDKTAIAAQLSKIAGKEKFKISEDALNLLAEHADGSLRDAESMLDQARNTTEDIDIEVITNLLGLPPKADIANLIKLYQDQAPASDIIKQIRDLYAHGFQANTIAHEIDKLLNQSMIDNNSNNLASDLNLMSLLIEVPASPDPARYLEISLLKNSIQSNEIKDSADKPLKTIKAANVHAAKKVEEQIKSVEPKEEAKKSPEAASNKPEAADDNAASAGSQEFDKDVWDQLLKALKVKYNTLYGIVKSAQASIDDEGNISLGFGFDFYRKRVSESTNKTIICDLYKQITGQTVNISCYLDKAIKSKPPSSSEKPKQAAPANDVATISNIFSGAEVIES